MEKAKVNGVDLAFQENGAAGDPLVLVHGSWVDGRIWSLVAPRLAESFRVLRYDRRGHGASDRGPGPYDIRRDAADLASLLEARDLFPAHVIGSSFGGAIALRLAGSRPELIRSVVVHEPPLFGLLDPGSKDVLDFRTGSDEVAALVADGEPMAASRRFVERFGGASGAWDRLSFETQQLLAANASRWFEEYSGPATFDVDRDELRAFDPPVLVTTGSLSDPVYARIADRLVEVLPNPTRRRLDGTGHLPPVTDPALYASAIFAFCLERNVPTS